MRKIFFLCLLVPAFGICQTKNVLSTNRVFPKVDKLLEFEKALTAHAQKYHTGDWKWRVFEIQSGPDYGGYHIVEGPTSWEAIDGRGNLGTEHNNDWNKTVAIHLTDRSKASYSVFQEELSTVQMTDYADKINIVHIFPKPGYGPEVRKGIEKFKKVWEEGKESVAVYTASSSGPMAYALVFRYKQGLKERTTGFRKPIKERYEAANGEDSWDGYLDMLKDCVDESWSELLFFRSDLSSK
jgi:hypothetical protein